MCMPTTGIGRPTLDTRVQPSNDFFFETHSRVVTAAIGLPKLSNVQNLHATSWVYPATHMCVFTAASGRPAFS